MRKVYAFDFDGTLTTSDTLLAFIRYAKGTPAFVWGFLCHAHLLVLMKLKLYPNWKAKQKVFSYFFKGMTIEAFNSLCQRFAVDSRSLLRPKGHCECEHRQLGAAFFPSCKSIGHTDRSQGWSSHRSFPHKELLRSGKGEPHSCPLS